MTEETEVPKITSTIKTPREKNPGRVAAGKRLAAVSKEAKERKKQQRQLKRENAIIDQYVPSESILVGGLVVVAGVALYFLSSERSERSEATAGSERSERTEQRSEEPERSERTKRTRSTERTERTRSTERSEGTERTEGRERPKRAFKPYSMDD